MSNSIRFGVLIAGSAVLAGLVIPAHAQTYPAKTIRMIVPLPPSGGIDLVGRLLSQKLSEQMGVTVVVDNRPGAGTVIGTEQLLRAPPDGYTLMMGSPTFTINPSLRKLPYDSNKDFSFITQVVAGHYILSTHPSVPVKNVKDLIALAKKRPGQLTYGSSGTGSANHLAGVLFQHMTKTSMVHVPYKGSGPAGTALIGGEIDYVFSSTPSVLPFVKSGKLKAIASTGPQRSALTPDIATIAESGVPGFAVTGFYMLMAHAATPPEIVKRLHAETLKALQSGVVKDRLATAGMEPVGDSTEACTAFIKNEIVKWADIVKLAGAKAED